MRLTASIFTCLAISFVASISFAQITVENSASVGFGVGDTVSQADSYVGAASFDVGAGTKLVVGVATENGSPDSFGVTFGGTALNQIVFSTDATGGARSALYYLDDVSGVGDIIVTLSDTENIPTDQFSNGPGIFIASLFGAEDGFESSGTIGNGQSLNGTIGGEISNASEGAYSIAVFSDNFLATDVLVDGTLTEVSDFNGPSNNSIGSASGSVATGFRNGAVPSFSFSDPSPNNSFFHSRSNVAFASFAASSVPEPGSTTLICLFGLAILARRRR